MCDTSYGRIDQLLSSKSLPWIIICIGLALRLIRYVSNPSFVFDEAVYAIDIINRSFPELMLPSTDWSAKPPYGFFLYEKIATELFGYSEYAFRLFPLLFSLFSVPLFYKVAKQYINPQAVPIALGFFVILDPVIFQATNLKPYSADLTFALFIFSGAIYIQSKRLNMARVVLMGLIGSVIIWFSHPSVFVFAGAGGSFLLYYAIRKQWDSFWKLFITASMWVVSFIAFYFIYTKKLIEAIGFDSKLMLQYENAFVPFPPTSFADIKWIIDNFFEVFTFPVGPIGFPTGFHFNGLSAFAFLIGCIVMFRKDREKLLLLLSPILFTLLAAVVHQFPFKGRMIMFLVPFLLFLMAEGIEFMRERISAYSAAAGVVLLVVLFVYPVSWASYHAMKPSSPEDIKPVIGYIEENWREGDIIYSHYFAQYPLEYYSRYHPGGSFIDESDYIFGIAPRGWYRTWRKQEGTKYYSDGDTSVQLNTEVLREYVTDLNKLKGRKRVWVLFSSTIYRDSMREESFFLYHLGTIGKRLDSFGRPGVAAVYLYDLSQKGQETDRL